MAKIVLACWGSYGDLFPSLAIADALTALGHEAVIASCPFYVDLVRAQGHAFRPLRPDVRPDDRTILRRVMDPQRGSEVVVREIAVPQIREAYEDMLAAAHDADLIVSHPITFAAPLAAETLKKPWLATALAPLSFFSMTDYPVLPNALPGLRFRKMGPFAAGLVQRLARAIVSRWTRPVEAFRRELGLPPAGAPMFEGQWSPHGTLALFARVFGSPQADWPAKTTVTGFPFSNRAIAMPAELAAFLDAGEPPVVFTLGSSAVSAAGNFYEESAAAIGDIGCRAVLLVGRHPENIPTALPPNVIAIDSAPHDQLFPRAAAIVHQCGVGTTGQALRSGKPQLAVPWAHDQPDNAFRLKTLGVGEILAPNRYRARRVAPLLRQLMGDAVVIARADAIGRDVRSETGAETAARTILAAI